MKGILYILAFYTLFLSCVPCLEECSDHERTTSSLNASEEHPERKGLCAPFCIDGCCAPHLICQPTQQIVLTAFDHDSAPITHHRELFPPASLHPVWQPPKISQAVIN